MRMTMGAGHGRPNDSRGFIHKKILGIGSKVLGFAGRNIPLPGAGILRGASEFLGGFADPVGRIPDIIGFRPPAQQASRFPGQNEFERLAERQKFGREADRLQSGASGASGRNGACPTACAPNKGNRRVNIMGECAPPGFHWNVAGYFRKGGPCSRFEAGWVEEGTVLVKNRRMNNANGRAQDRSLKRIEAGQDHAKRILRATGWRTISKQSSREMRMRRRGSRH